MITVTRIGKHLGAEISGVDLSQPLDDDTFAQVARAFFDNEVVFLRNQKITPEQQVAFTRRFGELLPSLDPGGDYAALLERELRAGGADVERFLDAEYDAWTPAHALLGTAHALDPSPMDVGGDRRAVRPDTDRGRRAPIC